MGLLATERNRKRWSRLWANVGKRHNPFQVVYARVRRYLLDYCPPPSNCVTSAPATPTSGVCRPTTNAKIAKQPTYRLRPDYGQPIVTLTDAVTRKRKDYWLGEYESPASYEMYRRVLAAWEGRVVGYQMSLSKNAVHRCRECDVNNLVVGDICGDCRPSPPSC